MMRRSAILAIKRPAARLSALLRNKSGATAVEMGLIAPVLFALLLGIAQFGYTYWLQNAMDYAVAAAARCASLGSCADPASYAASASGASFDSTVFTYTAGATCGGNPGNQVSASYSYSFVIPFMNLSMTLTSQACYPT